MPEHGSDWITRRRFVRDAGIATVAAAELLAAPAIAREPKRRRTGRQTVAVFGGGISGLTVAHELVERGFGVTVYERRAWGGRARSTEIAGTAAGGRRPLPGEHSFRVFLGFYENIVDTLRRIPFGSNANGAFDNLVAGPMVLMARDRGRRDLVLPIGSVDPGAITASRAVDLLVGLLTQTDLPPDAVAYLAQRMTVYFSSCDARRFGEWERMTWADFAGADRFSEDYRRIVVNTFGELLVSAKSRRISADWPAHIIERVLYSELGRGANGPTIRLLNRPTNEAFINPWLAVLGGRGVNLRNGCELLRFSVHNGRVTGAHVRTPHGTKTVRADWYVCALPLERARRALHRGAMTADPSLASIGRLETGLSNGIKFFLREETPIVKGLVDCIDSPWKVLSCSQAQFWPVDFASTYGDGRVRESLSAIIVDWYTPGIVYDKPAVGCTPDEFAHEIWEQLKRSLNDAGQVQLTDDLILSWSIDPSARYRHGRWTIDDRIATATVASRAERPDVNTAIPNLFLAGDYLKSDWRTGIMEAANYNGRRAANAVLDTSGSRESRATAVKPYRPPEWEPFKRIDEDRWRGGQPNLFDTKLSSEQLRHLLESEGRDVVARL
jgi:hypothetical protein